MKYRTGPEYKRKPVWITPEQGQREYVTSTLCWVCFRPLGQQQATRHVGITGRRKGRVTGWRHSECTNEWTENGAT